jgi:hypothetical protein
MPAADSDFHALWMQNLDYPARLDRVFADNIWTAGVLGGSSFEVTPSAPAALTVDVAAGVAVVAGADQTAQGKYLVRKQTPQTGLAIGAAPGSGQRNDLIVLEVRDPNASGPSGDDVRLVVVSGTPDVSPVDPTPPVTSLVLARVRVPVGTGTITSALIDDLRPQSDFQHPTGTDGLRDGAVTTVKIASNTILSANINPSVPLGLRQVQTFTSSGTWTKPSWLRAVRVRVQGGGGGGGGVNALANRCAAGQGGGGGSYAESFILASTLGSSVTVTVGGGGAGGAAGLNSGAAGGNSSFGALVVAGGGPGGGAGDHNIFGTLANTSPSQAGGTATAGDIRVPGSPAGVRAHNGANYAMGSYGGDSVLGVGARSTATFNGSVAGSAGLIYGGGGSGASSANTTTNRAGGAGAQGIVIVEMYE